MNVGPNALLRAPVFVSLPFERGKLKTEVRDLA
jgi:hypothetical protein